MKKRTVELYTRRTGLKRADASDEARGAQTSADMWRKESFVGKTIQRKRKRKKKKRKKGCIHDICYSRLEKNDKSSRDGLHSMERMWVDLKGERKTRESFICVLLVWG
jgi:hypothetical protein